jgi:DNA polymerase I
MLVLEKDIEDIKKEIGNAEYVALDTETVSLNEKTIVSFSFAIKNKVYFVPVRMKYFFNVSEEAAVDLLKYISEHKGLVFHHFAFDGLVLHEAGIDLQHAPHDTLIISHLLDENGSHKLKDLVQERLKYNMIRFKDICGTGKKQIEFRDVKDKEKAMKYASDDAEYTLRLFELLLNELNNNSNLKRAYEEVERPLLLVVNDMHIQGLPVDANRVASIEKKCISFRDLYKRKLDHYMANVNLDSPKQLKEYFIVKKGLQVIKRSKRTNEPSVDSDVLKKYARMGVNEADWILKYRFYAKITSTFIPALKPDTEGKIHPFFHQVGTTSGRFSSSNPNCQTLPRAKDDELGIRKCIKAPKGYKLVGFDYSAIELRLTAHFSNEQALIDAFKKGEDMHQKVADTVGCSRQQAKTINYGIAYGIGINALAKNMGTDRATASQYMANFRVSYPNILTFIAKIKQEVIDNGKVVMLYGRERHLPAYFEDLSEWEKGGMLRSIVNAVIQGSSAMMMKKAMVDIYKELEGRNAYLINTIHDELFCITKESEANDVAEIMKRCMVNAGAGLLVPIVVDGGIGKNWQEIH